MSKTYQKFKNISKIALHHQNKTDSDNIENDINNNNKNNNNNSNNNNDNNNKQ